MPVRSDGAPDSGTGHEAGGHQTSVDSARPRSRHPAALAAVVRSAATQTGIGPVAEYQVIQRGYEDLNLYLATSAGAGYVLKIFSQARSAADVARTLDLLRAATAAGVAHPQVLAGADGKFLLRGAHGGGWRAILMQRSAGRSIYDQRRPPNSAELAALLYQLTLLHASDYRPPFRMDDWSVDNAPGMLASVERHIDGHWRQFIQQAVAEFFALDRSALTSGLIHGDVTTGNVLVGADAGVELIDYSCANRSPVVFDLAVVVVNLLDSSPDGIRDRLSTVTAAYQQAGGQLNQADIGALPAVVAVSAAMEYLGAVHERVHNGDHTEENQYVESLGLRALRLLPAPAG